MPFPMKASFSHYVHLTKPRIVSLVLVTTALGYFLAGEGISSYPLLFVTLLGTCLTCGGAGVLNHYLERDIDCLMKRTRRRPIPAGIISPADALGFGLALFTWVFNP